MENDNDVYLEFNFKLSVLYRCTREDLWEQLVQRYLDVINTISVGDLNVLNFSGLGFPFKSFNSYKLDFKRFYLKFRMTLNDISFEWLSESTIGTIDGSTELEFWDCFGSGGFQTIIRNCELLLDVIFSVFQLNSLSWTFTEELLLSNSWLTVSIIVFNDDLVNNRELDSNV